MPLFIIIFDKIECIFLLYEQRQNIMQIMRHEHEASVGRSLFGPNGPYYLSYADEWGYILSTLSI